MSFCLVTFNLIKIFPIFREYKYLNIFKVAAIDLLFTLSGLDLTYTIPGLTSYLVPSVRICHNICKTVNIKQEKNTLLPIVQSD